MFVPHFGGKTTSTDFFGYGFRNIKRPVVVWVWGTFQGCMLEFSSYVVCLHIFHTNSVLM